MAKLHSYGLNGTELEWFTSYLFNQNAQVSYNGCISSPQKIGDGVPQGSILGPLLFILYFNDVVYNTEDVSIINYADDTVIYTANKEIKEINAKLSKTLAEISTWFSKNELILNVQKGKTEALLFGTAQRIRKCMEPLSICHEDGLVNAPCTYKCLGVQLDSSLTLSSDFDDKYKIASGRLRLLAKIRNHLDIESAKAIYHSMVFPMLSCCGILKLKLNKAQENKVTSYHNGAMKIIARNRACESISPMTASKRRACMLAHNILQNNVCHAFSKYFIYQEHSKNTRNSKYRICLPRLRTEYARKCFLYMGAMIFSELPLAASMSDNVLNFRKIMKYFMRNISPISSYFPRRDGKLFIIFFTLFFSVYFISTGQTSLAAFNC